MELKRFVGNDSKSAMEQVRANYGDDALIISTNKIGNKTEMICAVDVAPEKQGSDEPSISSATSKAASILSQAAASNPNASDTFTSNAFSNELGNAIAAKTSRETTARERFARAPSQLTEHAETGAPSSNELQQMMQTIQGELAELRSNLEQQAAANSPLQRAHAAVTSFNQRVDESTHAGIPKLLEQINQLSRQAICEQQQWAGSHLFLGAPGAGKTTAIAKLVTQLAASGADHTVAVISYRPSVLDGDADDIAALMNSSQSGISVLCQRLNLPFFQAHDPATLANLLNRYRESHQIFIDTEAGLLGAEEELVRLITDNQIMAHLCFSSDSSTASLVELQQRVPWIVSSLILTRFDLVPELPGLCDSLLNSGAKVTGLTKAGRAIDSNAANASEPAHPNVD